MKSFLIKVMSFKRPPKLVSKRSLIIGICFLKPIKRSSIPSQLITKLKSSTTQSSAISAPQNNNSILRLSSVGIN